MKVGTTAVKEIYFNHQDLTRINGEPIFAALHHMMLQLKASILSVLCTLGGCAYGYIGIILSTIVYTTLAPFTLSIVPVPLRPLNVTNSATQYQIAHTRVLHETATHTFSKYKLVQRVLIQQVLDALKVNFLTRLHERVTS